MEALSPKKREIAEREERILAVARPMIIHDGYHGLSMDRIANEVGYSKGTIYNHFSCKEEVIIALAGQNSARRLEMFRLASGFRERSRFRMLAIGFAAEEFVRRDSAFFQFEQILELPSVREKTSEKRQAVIRGCEMQCMTIIAGVARDAIANGDLDLQDRCSPEEFVFGLWSLTSGAYNIILNSGSLDQLGISDPWAAVRMHVDAILDGNGWAPLSTEYDGGKLLARIRKEVTFS